MYWNLMLCAVEQLLNNNFDVKSYEHFELVPEMSPAAGPWASGSFTIHLGKSIRYYLL